MPQKIPLSKGKFTIVDDADYKWLSQWKWSYSGNGYAIRSAKGKDGQRKYIYMHRQILDAPDGKYVDHINHDTLDNRRFNLRVASPTESIRNTRPRKNGKSVFKGVTLVQNRWQVSIQVGDEKITVGRYLTQREAAAAYNKAAKTYFGEFAVLNDIDALPASKDKPLNHRKLTSKFHGVHFDSKSQLWHAQIMVDRKKHRLGRFKSEIDAAKAYDKFVIDHDIDRPLNLS